MCPLLVVTDSVAMTSRPPFISIFLLSASALAYEILLIHLFSIISYHHFAYMIISLALLGYGMSGTCLSIWRVRLSSSYPIVYLSCIILFGCSVSGSFLLAQEMPFNGEEILWDKYQMVYLCGQFLLLSLPFFFAATAIGITLSTYSGKITTTYCFDLLGAGVGSLLVILLLFLLSPKNVLIGLTCTGFLAALIAGRELQFHRRAIVARIILLLMAGIIFVGLSATLKISPYKSLMYSLRIEGSRIIDLLSSPLGVLHVVENKVVPFRHVPGMSLTAEQEPLEQIAVFTNGDNLSVITKKTEEPEHLSYLDQITSALPYHLDVIDTILLLGVGGGDGILQARYHGVKNVEGVELNPQMVMLLTKRHGEYSGFSEEDTKNIHTEDIRGFMHRSKKKYDLIQLSLTDSFGGSGPGLSSLKENYLYTVEALQEYMDHLSADGYLAITRWIKIPPRDTLKIFATAVSSLSEMGVTDLKRHLLLIRSWQTSTLLIKKSAFEEIEIRKMEIFCNERSFDIGYSFLTTNDQVNRFNILRQPLFFQGAEAMVSGKGDSFIADYKFNIRPSTDNRPYFHQFLKWSSLPEILKLRKQGGIPLLESGYLVLLGTLLVTVLLSLILIIVPLIFLKRDPLKNRSDIFTGSVLLYFFFAGICFLFIEIAFIQKFTLYLYHPVYSISITLASFLTFAGVGSQLSRKIKDSCGPGKTMFFAVSGVVSISILYLCFLDDFFVLTSSFSLPVRFFITVALIAPPAIFMGMPFPLGLENLADSAKELIPWAWGINGCASVISAMSAPLVAIHFGFPVVLSVALTLYPLMYLLFPKTR